jgi:hypothetical protein
MAAANLIVCEQRGNWAAALRRALGTRVELRETRSLSQCGRELNERPAGTVAVELTAERVERVAAFVVWLGECCPETRPIVLAERRLAPLEWWLREVGAAHFVTSPRQLEPLAEIVARQRRRAAKPSTLSWTDKLWAELPWGD